MTDNRQMPPGDDLPEWLKGHIHDQPDEEPVARPARPKPASPGREVPPGDSLDFLEDVGGAPEPGVRETRGPTAEQPGGEPFHRGAGKDAEEPSAGPDLSGMTSQLPWLADVGEQPTAEPPASGDEAVEPKWLTEEETPAAPSPDLPDTGRLRGLTGQLPWLDDTGLTEETPAAEEPAFPDWLDQAPSPPSLEEEPAFEEPEAALEPAADLPDWISQTGSVEEPESEGEEAPGGDLPDWLGSVGAFEDSEIEEPLEGADSGAAVPDWLAAGDLEEPLEEEPGEAELVTAAAADAMPDWLSAADEFVVEAEAEEPLEPYGEEAPAEAGSAPQWLITDSGEFPGDVLPAEAAPEAGPEEDLTYEEWQELQEEVGREPSEEELLAEEVPDWFEAIAGEEAEAPPPAPEAAPAAPAEEGPDFVPDWYLGLEEQDTSEAPEWFGNLDFSADALTAEAVLPEKPPEPAAPTEAALELSPEEVPDLLSDVAEEGAPPTPPAAPAEEVPDWFADVMEQPAGEAPGAEVPPAGVEEPDWMAEFEVAEEPETPAQPAPATGEEIAPGEAPDWLEGLAPEMPEVPDEADLLTPEALLEGGEDFMSVIDGEMGEPEAEPGVSPDAQLTAPGGSGLDLRELLAEAAMLPIDQKPAPAKDEPGQEMPDWLAESRPVESVTGVSAVTIARRQQDVPLEELTDRLKALHSRMDSVVSAKPPDAPADIAGATDVLAEVRGGLSPVALFDEPGGREVVLDVTLDKAQEARVSTLASLLGLEALAGGEVALDEEGVPIPVDKAAEAVRIKEAAQRARARSRRKPGRLVISLLLALAVVLPFFVDLSSLIDLPEPVLRPEVNGTIDVAIQRLMPGDLVLVGFEYGPTAAGELDPLAETLMTHVLLRGAKPVVISTNPAGILHAREVLDRLAQDEFLLAHLGRATNQPLTMPDNYVILPFLPGGVVGLRSLTATSTDANALDRGIFTVDLEGNPTGLRIRYLQVSFKLALTIAETGEDVRYWVDQIGSAVDLPLGAAVTVAAEPITRPYFESGQLIGLLAGYRDAYIYDSVLLAALPPVRSLPLAQPTSSGGEEGAGGEEAAVEGELPAVTPTSVVVAQGLITNTPLPSATPTLTSTPSVTPSPTMTPTVTPTPSDRDLTATARAQGTPTVPPSPTPREFITATPVPEGAVVQPTPLPTQAFEGNLLEPDRTYRVERWYSTMLGALVATALIGMGGIVNIVRWIRRRRDQ